MKCCAASAASAPTRSSSPAPLWVPFRMHKKLRFILPAGLILLAATHQAQAQSTPATPPAAAAAPAPAAPPPSAAKKALIERVVKLQQPGIEAMSTDMAQEPALQMLERAAALLQARVPAEKRDAAIKGVQADAKKYMDKTVPMVNGRAVALAPDAVGAVLNQRLSEDELKKIVAILESPEYAKFQQLRGEMQTALQAKLVADTRNSVETNLRTLESDLSARLTAFIEQPPAAAGSSAPDKAAKPAPAKTK
jgi:uncharacterized protein